MAEKGMWEVNRRDKVFLAMFGFLGGASFTILAFRFNHKDILNESPYFWLLGFLVSFVVCLWAVFKENDKSA
jgi:hypothetical protein